MEWLSLSGDLTRENAVEQLLAPSTSADVDSELCVHAGSVQRLDTVTAAAVRLRIARHHRERGNHVGGVDRQCGQCGWLLNLPPASAGEAQRRYGYLMRAETANEQSSLRVLCGICR